MASTSTASIQKSFKYDVFLSFRGEDTRKNFVDHLYYALEQKSIYTFKDDEIIRKGRTISHELIKAIEDSKLCIIVFSKNYASSSWCLDELVKIMECQKTSEHTAYPVFYDVEPTEVRKQSGAVGKAFVKHEKDEVAWKWREALKEAADLTGWELKNTTDGHEAKFIQKIIEEISLELRFIDSSVDDNLVGMETRVNEVISSLKIGDDDVLMVGIKGMGGAGKTTLARAVFDRISFQFEGKSFVENVREVSKASSSGLKTLQEQVLSVVLQDQDINVSDEYEGKHMIKKKMNMTKVLIVLDDVDDIEQLQALASERNWFKPGSIIIITTRDEQVLRAHKVNLIRAVNLLSDKEAICLFSRHAFGTEIPVEGYKELSEQVVHYAAGLPLTIRVLGSFLCGQNIRDWKDAIERLKTIPLRETLEKLELSYNALEKDYQEIFLDVACILKGRDTDEAIVALESCGFHARNGLRVLEQRSLITISNDGKLGMHDHIEEMGKNIVRHLHPNKPYEHSRLWIDKEIEYILGNDLGTEATKCITLQTNESDHEFLMKDLRNLKELRFLLVDSHVSNPTSEGEISSWCFPIALDEVRLRHSIGVLRMGSLYLPNSLQYLEWFNYPFRSLPETFQANNLVTLHMKYGKMVQLWKHGKRKVLNNLRFLKICESKLKTLDIRFAPNLEKLCLTGCHDLVRLRMPTESLKLKSIVVSYSEKLRILDLGITLNLEELTLRYCNNLVELFMPAKSLMLRNLRLDCSKLRNLRLGITPNLEKLSLIDCHDLVELIMPDKCLQLICLEISHSKLTTLDLGLTPYLKILLLNNCCDLVEVNVPVGCLERVVYLESNCCGLFDSFTFDRERDLLEAGSLFELQLIADHKGIYCDYIEDRASSVGNLERLISAGLCAGKNIESFIKSICGLQCLRKLTLEGSFPEAPKDFGQLECLEELILSSTDIKILPDSICMLKHLKSLEIISSWDLEKLPDDIGRLECLEELILTECTLLQDIPNSICELKRLEHLDLSLCIRVEKLPEEIGHLECLKDLDIKGTGISRLPQSLFRLKGLRIVGSRWLLESCGFTSKIESINDVAFCYI